MGRFGDSPFLFASYGSGELPQCFCRMSAVFGGICFLHMTVDTFSVNKATNQIETIATRCDPSSLAPGQPTDLKFNCKHLIVDSSYLPDDYYVKASDSTPSSRRISRSVLITNKSIFPDKKNDSLNEQVYTFLPKINYKAKWNKSAYQI